MRSTYSNVRDAYLRGSLVTGMDPFQGRVADWATATFGGIDPAAVLLHIREEVDELEAALLSADRTVEDADEVAGELADLGLMLMQLATYAGVSFAGALYDKQVANEQDEFEFRPELGYSKRVKR